MTELCSAATSVVSRHCKVQSAPEKEFDSVKKTLNAPTDVAQTPKRTAA